MQDSLNVAWLGRVRYADAYALQRRVHAEVASGARPPTVLLLEHEPVITRPKRADPSHVLDAGGVELVETDRGGDVTLHAPGQLVAYGLMRLRDVNLDARGYLTALEEVMIRVCAGFGVTAGRVAGRTGAWVGRDKIGAIGVRLVRWTTLHGFALNVDPDLALFNRIVPCGLRDAGVTSLAKILGRPVEMGRVVDEVSRRFGEVLGRRIRTLDPSPTAG